ncbi:CAP domain-containing protein [Streptomyces sp. NPDC097981]|uniref:CAP domain-containing protein n=1 Tax=Streptomyces sp. NPDC097981 TaxID=3155428 RepID=UPI0033288349
MGRHRLHATPAGGAKRRALVRTGLLGVSVAVVLGTAAVTTGTVPVGTAFPYVGVSADGPAAGTQARAKAKAETKASPSPDSITDRQGGLVNLSGRASSEPATSSPSPSASPSPSTSPSPSAAPASPIPSASPTPSTAARKQAKPETKPETKPEVKPDTKPEVKPDTKPETKPVPVPPKTAAPKPPAPAPTAAPKPAPAPADGHSAEEAAVLALVNQERAQAGCGPVRANPPLAALAGAFSKDMATRGFFAHTDPDGNTPWDRATKAGLGGLGGENIARGQGDAQSVMNAWMNSPGHKANILNCEFRTLGVGVYFAADGPWWTQDFGF